MSERKFNLYGLALYEQQHGLKRTKRTKL